MVMAQRHFMFDGKFYLFNAISIILFLLLWSPYAAKVVATSDNSLLWKKSGHYLRIQQVN